jgi:hypothetical protein
MKRRRSRDRIRRFLLACVTTVVLPGHLAAQATFAQEGALFLLVPVGARAVGMGQAIVADRPGSEAVWWNPAALASADKREAAVHHSQSLIGTGDAISLVWPASLLGVLTASVNIVDFGEQEQTVGGPGAPPAPGRLIPRGLVLAGTYATEIGKHLSAGITYKLVQFRVDCSGACGVDDELNASTSALDFGLQVIPLTRLPLVLAASVRNVGLKLQVNDNPQSDPLPRRLQVGALYEIVPPEDLVRDVVVRMTLDVVDELEFGNPSVHLGTDLAYRQRAHLRAGYAFRDAQGGSGPAYGGPALGLGLVAGSFTFDIARVFGGVSADAGQSPTFFSLRFLF